VIKFIFKVIEDETENGIVRHEAIGAYSGITDAKDILYVKYFIFIIIYMLL
jgi:hypothetical protein